MTRNTKLRGQHALKLFVSTEMKTQLDAMAQSLDRPLADVCRILMWIGLPIMQGLDAAQERGADWWVKRFQGGDGGQKIEETS